MARGDWGVVLGRDTQVRQVAPQLAAAEEAARPALAELAGKFGDGLKGEKPSGR